MNLASAICLTYFSSFFFLSVCFILLICFFSYVFLLVLFSFCFFFSFSFSFLPSSSSCSLLSHKATKQNKITPNKEGPARVGKKNLISPGEEEQPENILFKKAQGPQREEKAKNKMLLSFEGA